jgi:signal transduction histidine kinase
MRRRKQATKRLKRKMTKMVRRDAQTAARGPSIAELQAQLEIRTRERDEAFEQQAATADVLKVISSSTGKLEPVFQTILENSITICEAKFGMFWLTEGYSFRCVALHGTSPAFTEMRRRDPIFHPNPTLLSPLGRLARSKQLEHVADCRAEQAYIEGDPGFVALVDLAGARTILVVPILRDNDLVGALNIFRQEVRPFTDKQIELVSHFAAQAVIAIENTRLLNELRQRTDDLSESLEQQTATSEVLKVISSSPGELEAVFNTMLANATRICEATFGNMFLREGSNFRAVAVHGKESYVDHWKRDPLINLGEHPLVPLARVTSTKQVLHIPDFRTDQAYTGKDSRIVPLVEVAGARSFVMVPMLKDDEIVGTIAMYRQEVRPFSEKQIDLVQNFAAQAVIAIENTRLLNELRESLQQQTATADVLRVISISTTDVNPVFEAMLKSASRLCNSKQAAVFRFDAELLHLAATENWPAEALATYASRYPMPPNPHLTVGRVVLTKNVVIQEDTLADASYEHAVATAGGWRRMLGVPMVHDGNVIGVIVLAWQEPGPVLPRYVELLQTFAAQAVIAIENVRLFKELRSRTHELTASLDNLRTTQDRLVQTQKLALLGQLTAGIAHEIKNPLNFVNNFSGISAELIDELQDTLKGMPLDDKARTEINELTGTLKSNFDKVVHHGRRADAIVKNMLQHSREGSGEHRVVDINALVEESLNLAWHGARAETQGFEIKLRQSFDPSAGAADIFPQDIRRALLNMISNGFYAATRRRAEINGGDYEPTLTASTNNLGDRVEIGIRDNGTGMTVDVKEKMFNPFFTTKPTGEGTGLGLSISHDIIVKQHGGSIEVDTQPGEFTEITVILPRNAVFL